MAFLSESVETLSAAFAFGILLQTAAGGVFLYLKGHGSIILKEGRRLVLLAFLAFAALWAQLDFIALLLPTSSPNVCQGILIVTTTFDQLARLALEQFLLWSIAQGTKASLVAYILQGIWLTRLVAGVVLVGFSRPEFAPTCVARTSLLPVSITVLSLDLILIGCLIVRAISLGLFGDLRDKQAGLKKQQSKALLLTIAGFMVWTATSVAMILGVSGFALTVRTSVPATGLLILVGMVTIFANVLLSTNERDITTPEAHSPFVGPGTTSRDLPGSIVGGSAPMSANKYAKNGRLFVVNETAQESSSNYQTRPQRSSRGFSRLDDDAPQFGSFEQGRTATSGNGPGYRGSSGVFGSIVGAPMIGFGQATRNPPAILPYVSEAGEAAVVKKSLFGWSSKPPQQTPVRARGISGPIMASGGEARVMTIDLATAARNERERREAATAVGSRVLPTPLPPKRSSSLNVGLSNPVGLTRKDVPLPPHDRIGTVQGTISSSLLPVQVGLSTATSLSPGHEEVRRRSPRNMSSFDSKFDEKPAVPVKLQRPKTIGLPSNPRSQRSETSKEIEPENNTTIMRMNNIVYENPVMVNSIIQDAEISYLALQQPKAADPPFEAPFATTPMTPNSIIHRPRPYRKSSDGGRGIFPAEALFGHSRSKSASAALTTKSSVFSNTVGSPTGLPPLPPLPTTASELKKLLPSDNRSMTFDEKIQLLFPAPPRSAIVANRRSSVSSVPRLRSFFIPETPQTKHSTTDQSNRASKRTTIASFAMLADASFDASSPKPHSSGSDERQTSPNSQRTSHDSDTISDENRTFGNPRSDISTASIPEIVGTPSPALNLALPIYFQRPIEQPLEPESPKQTEGSSSIKRASTIESDDGTVTDWGSIHSEIPVVDLREARRNARSTFIRGAVRDQLGSAFQNESTPEIEPFSLADSNPALLDGGSIDNFETANTFSSPRSSMRYWKKDSMAMDRAPSLRKDGAWHHRIGDQLPTFSERESHKRARKMPPPTPLMLNKMGRSTTHILVQAAEPSPVESPERAIEEIKAQLARLEEDDQESYDFVYQDKDNKQMQVQDRLRLLENLEKEMNDQEDQWQQLNQDRNSSSTTLSISPSNASYSRNSSRRTSKRISQVSIRNDHVRIIQPKGDESPFTTLSQNSDNARASIWQARLAEAQLAYRDNAPLLLRKSLNFLAMPNMQIASPTPPESEESCTDMETEHESESESESDVETAYVSQKFQPKSYPAKLWQYPPSSPQAAMGRLWCHPYETVSHASILEPPAKNLRPLQRSTFPPLKLESSALWTKPSVATTGTLRGLWRSKVVRQKSVVPKRVSVKPMRKSRRLTVLPDIVESPVPLPFKRDTLGIYQFPWGETSDQAIYQPSFVPVPFSNFTTNSKLNARSMELEPEGAEYSSSFFDEYDDEEEGDSEANYDSSDDEFDDNTLLEIADLLKSDEVPSRQSLFSPESIVGAYASDSDFDSASDVDVPAGKISQVAVRLPIPPLSHSQTRKDNSGYDVVASTNVMSRDDPAIALESPIETRDMWMPLEPAEMPNTHVPSVVHEEPSAAHSIIAASVTLLWSAPMPTAHVTSSHGLFDPASPPTTRRTTTLEPAALYLAGKPRFLKSSLPSLESTTLWNGIRTLAPNHHWISESSVSPPSPSMYSPSLISARTTSSSGSSSFDVSDTTSITTASTNASTLWATMSTSTPSWWQSRSLNKDSTPSVPIPDFRKTMSSPMDVRVPRDAEPNSKIPKLRRRKSIESSEKPQEASAAATTREPKTEQNSQVKKSEKAQGMEFLSIRNSLRATPRVVTTQKKQKPAYHRIRSSEEDWDRALAEAVTLGSELKDRPISMSGLWSVSANIPGSDSSPLWTKASVSESILSPQAFDIFAPRSRMSIPAENIEFASIQSTELWRPRKAPVPAPLAQLWSAAALDSSLGSPKAMFAHIKSGPVKKSTPYRPATLQELNSRELFEPVADVEKPLRTHWLLRTALSRLI